MPSPKFDAFLSRVFAATGISSQIELAGLLGVNRSAITQARKKDTVPARWLLFLYRRFGLRPDWLETGAGGAYASRTGRELPEFTEIPKVRARLCAGGGSFETGMEVVGRYAFQQEWLRRRGQPDRMVLMDVFGNSMEPEIRDGDTILIDQGQRDILAGAVYAVGIEDTILVKRVEKRPDALVLLSDNPAYAPINLRGEEADRVRIIGKVLWSCRELR